MNIFGTELCLQTKIVKYRGASVVVTETTDEDYHRYVTLPMIERERDEPEEIVEFNREATLRMLAISLMPGLKLSFDEIYSDLRTPGKYSRTAIGALIDGVNEVNGANTTGNSPTTTLDSD